MAVGLGTTWTCQHHVYVLLNVNRSILKCSPVHTLSAFFVVAEGQLQTTEASKPLKTTFLNAAEEEDTHSCGNVDALYAANNHSDIQR